MTEVMINGVVRTIRDSTLTKYNKIKALHARGYTFRKIKDELKCSNQTIQDALGYSPNRVPKIKGTIGTSQLNTPPPPPLRDSVPILIGTKKEHDEKTMWDTYEAKKRTSTVIKTHVPEAVFTACAFYLQTRSKRVKDAKNPATSSEQSIIRSIENWDRFQEWKSEILQKNKKDLMIELKEKIQKRNGGV